MALLILFGLMLAACQTGVAGLVSFNATGVASKYAGRVVRNPAYTEVM